MLADLHRRMTLFVSRRWRPVVVLVLVVIGTAGLYTSTLMRDVSKCPSYPTRYCDDSVEFQIALAAWGTVHATGYPLYMLIGSPLVTAWRALGMSPATAGSLYSLVWQVVAIAGVFLLMYRRTRLPALSGLTALAVAVTRSMWIHGSLAEVYSLSMALTVWIMWLTFDLHDHWSDRKGWWLALAAGLGVAHHRLIAVMLPVVGIYLLPSAWRSGRFWRWLAVAILCFAAGFLPYVDIPLRTWLGSSWLYSRVDNWDDFWRIFAGSEYPIPLNMSADSIGKAAGQMAAGLEKEVSRLGLVLCTGSALLALIRARRLVGVWWGIGISYVLFTLLVGEVMLEVKLMPIVFCLLIAAALGVSKLSRRWRAIACGLLAAGCAYLIVWLYPQVTALTHDRAGRQYIEQVERLEAPPGAVLMALWGQSFFDLAYAQRFEGRLSDWRLVDHRADFKTLSSQADGRVYMSADTLYVFGVNEWRRHLGEPLRLTSAGPGLLAVTARPLPPPPAEVYPIGDGLALAGWEVRLSADERSLNVVTEWVALRPPSGDYSTYVHVTDRDDIVAPDDLVGQSDFSAPVYGWYPTSEWQLNEVVREDHSLNLPPGRRPRTIKVGMYQVQADGRFVPLGQVTLTRQADGWQVRRSDAP